MSSVQLATMSTALWVVATVSLFILLAEWSGGASWGLTTSIVRGVRGWSDRHAPPASTASSPFVEPHSPFLDPSRPIGGVAARRLPAEDRPPMRATGVAAEVVDLGEHRLPR
jgi:hypothetical protein